MATPRKAPHERKRQPRPWHERYEVLLPDNELRRLRRAVGVPPDGPTRAMHRRWTALETANPIEEDT